MTYKSSVLASFAGAALTNTTLETGLKMHHISANKAGRAVNWTTLVIFTGFLLFCSLSSLASSLSVKIPLFLHTEPGAKMASMTAMNYLRSKGSGGVVSSIYTDDLISGLDNRIPLTGLKGIWTGLLINDSIYNSATKTGGKITSRFSQSQSASAEGVSTTRYATGTPSASSPASTSPGNSGDKDDDDDQSNRDKLPKGWQPGDGDGDEDEYRCDYCSFTGTLTDVEKHEHDCPHRGNRINHILLDTPEAVAQRALSLLIDRISAFSPSPEHPYFVLVLPTGRTPERLYQLLIEAVNHGRVALNRVVMFNMDEYIGASPENQDSYNHYMNQHLLQHNPGFHQVHLYNGSLPPQDECMHREQLLGEYGHIDLLLGGVGENGHIAFNEPGSPEASRTRRVRLTRETIRVNSQVVEGQSFTEAMTIGMANIMEAKEVIILATGERKQWAVWKALHFERTTKVPVTLLQKHKNVKLITDQAAHSSTAIAKFAKVTPAF